MRREPTSYFLLSSTTRHYVELALKYIIEEYGTHAGVFLGKKNHNLRELWGKFVEIGKRFGQDPTDDAALAVEGCIAEFDAIDLTSTVFRYATDVKGHTPPLPSEGLNLVGLHDVMNGIETFFECVDQAYSSALEEEQESTWLSNQ